MSAGGVRPTAATVPVHLAVVHGDGHRDAPRSLLAAALGVPPRVLEIDAEGGVKPRVTVPATTLSHSVSHTPDATVVAWAHGHDVGVDAEPADRVVAQLRLWAHVLTPAERALLSPDEPARSGDLLRAWVRKEALLKAAGVGISVEPATIELSPDGTVRALPPALGDPAEWSLHDLGLPSLVAAVACHAPRSVPVLSPPPSPRPDSLP